MRVVRLDLDGLIRVLWVLPLLPPSLNTWERAHWGFRKQTKDRWSEYVSVMSRKDALPQDAEWVYVEATIVFRRGAHRDLTNYSSTLQKIFPDVLMRAGVLSDDTADQMKWGDITMEVDKTLRGEFKDPRIQGSTRLAVIAKG